MILDFVAFRDRLAGHIAQIAGECMLFDTDIDRDRLWELYLDSFPPGTNELYKTRRQHDCACCRSFLKRIGCAVYIDGGYRVHSIFELDAGSPVYQPVMDALARYVTEHGRIVGRYWSLTGQVGEACSHQMTDEGVVTWNHMSAKLPKRLVFQGSKDLLPTETARFNDTRKVFRRSLEEISLDAIDTVLELIASNSLYKGEEWKDALGALRGHKAAWEDLDESRRELYCWARTDEVGMAVGRIRNHSMGVLLTDLSGGMGLDEAVRRYEKIVAPTNYKRPKAIFNRKMLEDARRTLEAMGYMDALPRRFATLDDISVNNILFSNKDAGRRIQGGNVFDLLAAEVKPDPRRFNRVEEIGIEKFISGVLPGARELEAFVESRHASNLVSLIAPVNREAKSMFKWNNGFSWAYAGNLTDSDIRENVKNAGGRVDGVLRFSLQWNDVEDDFNDLDAHCQEPNGGDYIQYNHKVSGRTGGNLDIDIINPVPHKAAVENITWPDRGRMLPGTYLFMVHCFTNRGGKSGFRAEIEFDGQIYRFDYGRPMKQKEKIAVAAVTLHPDGSFSIEEKLDAQASSRELWGVKTNQFVPVSVVMYSPNYWDQQRSESQRDSEFPAKPETADGRFCESSAAPEGVGHRHYMFMLKGCVNPERPNGFYNEFLKSELGPHKRVFEALGGKMAVADAPDQLSGLGFSSTRRNNLVVKVKGATERVMKILF